MVESEGNVVRMKVARGVGIQVREGLLLLTG